MRYKSLAVAAAFAAAAAFTPHAAGAAALPGAKSLPQSHIAATTLLEDVRHRRWHRHRHHRVSRCTRVRHACAHRFGWRSFGYRTCVINRGCW